MKISSKAAAGILAVFISTGLAAQTFPAAVSMKAAATSSIASQMEWGTLKIGGGGFTRAQNAFIEGFMKSITSRDEAIPLDFYSWHLYFVDIEKFLEEYRRSASLLKSYGCEHTENIFDEWNYMRNWADQSGSYIALKSHIGASFCAATLAAMQTQTDIAAAAYFEGDVTKEWCGLFDVGAMSIGAVKATVKKLKPFYAFLHFGDLYRLGNAVQIEAAGSGIYACAACAKDAAGILAANYTDTPEDAEVTMEISGFTGTPTVRVTDAERTDEPLDAERRTTEDGRTVLRFVLPGHSFAFVEMHA